MLNTNQKNISFLFFTAFCEFFSRGIILIFLSYLLLKTNFFFLETVPFEQRFRILALIFCLFPVGMFLGAMPLGILSDKFGRYPLLVFSIFLGLLGSLLTIVGLYTHSLYWMGASRFIAGLGAGNISLIWAIVNSVSSKQKAENIATIQLAIALGFMIGPAIGGGLLELHNDYISSITALSLMQLCLLAISLCFLKQFHTRPLKLAGKKSYQLRGWWLLLFAWLGVMFGWVGFREFLPAVLLNVYALSSGKVGAVYLYIGVVYILTTFFLLKRLLVHCSKYFVVVGSLFNMLVFIEIITNFRLHFLLFFSLFIYTVASAIAIPTLITYILSHVDENQKGSISGLLTSAQAVMMVCAALAATFARGPAVFLSISAWAIGFGLVIIICQQKTSSK